MAWYGIVVACVLQVSLVGFRIVCRSVVISAFTSFFQAPLRPFWSMGGRKLSHRAEGV